MNKKNHQLTFILPGLFEGLIRWPENNAEKEIAPALLWFFSRSSKNWRNVQGFDQTILDTFCSDYSSAEELPVAILRTQTESDGVICADPVSLQLGVSEVNLTYGQELQLTKDDIDDLSSHLNRFFEKKSMRLSLESDGYGVLFLDKQPDLLTTSLSAAAGSIYRDKLPIGKDQLHWHHLGNEIQMHLHNSDFNQRREAEGKLPVNTLWFWGAGKSRPKMKKDFDQVFASDGLTKTLTAHQDDTNFTSPDTLQALSNSISKGHTLVVLDHLWPLSQKDDYLGWCRELSQYEKDWFQPLKEGLQKHQISRLLFRTTTGECFGFHPLNRFKFWRTATSFHEYLSR